MSPRKGKNSENFDQLIESVKPKGARYLQEKYQYWMDTSIPSLREKVASELDSATWRSLLIRGMSTLFGEFRTMERTGSSFIALQPGIEFGGNGVAETPVCDVLLRSPDGSSLFLILLQDQRSSPGTIRDLISSRYRFIHDNLEGFSEAYGVEGGIRIGLVLTGPERQNIGKGLQLLGRTDEGKAIGEVQVLTFYLVDGTIQGMSDHDGHGLKGSDEEIGSAEDLSAEDGSGSKRGLHLKGAPLDLSAQEYLLFELVVVQGAYADHLMHDEPRPKEFTLRELHSILYRELGISGRDHNLPEKVIERRRALARKRLTASLNMAMKYHLVEDSGEDVGLVRAEGGKEGRPETIGKVKEPYRLICQGTDLTIVRNNLRKKYVDGCGSARATPMAKRKAVEAYRRRFPRIDKSF